jgi:hypothetical protein
LKAKSNGGHGPPYKTNFLKTKNWKLETKNRKPKAGRWQLGAKFSLWSWFLSEIFFSSRRLMKLSGLADL